MEETMNKIVKALRAQGYKLTVSRLTVEETVEWNSMISKEVMEQVRPTLTTEDNLQWHSMIVEEELNSSVSII